MISLVGLENLSPTESMLSVLLVATKSSKIFFYAYGYVHFATLDIQKTIPTIEKILSLECSHDTHMLSIVAVDKGNVSHLSCDLTTLSYHHKEVFIMTHKFLEIKKLLEYGEESISQLKDIWDSLMIELDSKFDGYSYVKTAGVDVMADLLDLFVFGGASLEFSMFMTSKLTEKGLKKLRQTAESAFMTMKKILVCNLQGIAQALIFLLSHMTGLSNSLEKCKPLGLSDEMIYEGITEASAFFLKTNELDEVITTSMKNFLAFLRWISACQLRCSNNPVPTELAKVSEKENNHIMNFLSDAIVVTIKDRDGKTYRKMKIKSISQYLSKSREVKCPLDNSKNPWLKFIEEHPKIRELPIIIPSRRDTSLLKEFSLLCEKFSILQKKSLVCLSETFHIGKSLHLFHPEDATSVTVVQKSFSDKEKMNIMILPSKNSEYFYFSQISSEDNYIYKLCTEKEKTTTMQIAKYTFPILASGDMSVSSISSSTVPYVSDTEFYDSGTVSILVQDVDAAMNSIFVQLPISALEQKLSNVTVNPPALLCESLTSVTTFIPDGFSSYQKLEVAPGVIGVSGERKVSVVLTNGNHSISLYEMDADEEDEDELDDTLEK